jgi:hypothetical protein
MPPVAAPVREPWYLTPRFVRFSLVTAIVLLVAEGYLAVILRDNDFLVHRMMGCAFLAGDPCTAHQPQYMPGRSMIDALTAWMPYRLDRALYFAVAVAAFVAALRGWHRLATPYGSCRRGQAFAAAVFALILVGGYVKRDLDDCGLQIGLLFVLTLAALCLQSGNKLGCGLTLGLAAAYKTTPLLFFPYLLWKRQWRAAAWMTLFTALANLLPLLYLGWQPTLRYYEEWFACARSCAAMEDPSQNPIEPPRHLNQGFTPAVARFLQTHPPGHPLAVDHPWFVQPGNLSAAAAKRGVQLVTLALGFILAWRFRRPWGSAGHGADLANEWAAVTALCAILSPLCWLQHLVLVVPCVFLWMRAWLSGAMVPRWHWLLLLPLGIIGLLAHRDLMTASFYELLLSYKLHTLAGLGAVTLALTLPDSTRASVTRADTRTSLPQAQAA